MLKIAWTEDYVLPLPPNHRFPMSKYEMLPLQLLHEGTIGPGNIFHPEPIAEKCILATHDRRYWERLKSLSLSPAEVRRTGFPLSEALVRRETVIAHGTLLATDFAIENGVAMNIAGGTHGSRRGFLSS